MALPLVLREHGVDPAGPLAEFGLSVDVYDNPDNTIRFATSCRLLERCAVLTGCGHFGLLVGQRAHGSSLGAIGFLAQSSADVRAALNSITRYFRLHNTSVSLELRTGGLLASLRYTIVEPGIDEREQLLDGVMAVAFNLMRKLCGDAWRPAEVQFAHARPPDPSALQQFFAVPLVFDAASTALVFAAHWLDAPVAGADPLLRSMMQQQLRALESRSREDLVSRVRRLLPAMLAARAASSAEVARRVELGVRTLNRRLASQGTSLARLRDEARYTLARQLLKGTEMPARGIAEQLGYANASAFTCAFRRWSGMGPARWRTSVGRGRPRRARGRAAAGER